MKVIHITTSLKNGGAEAVLYRLVICNSENTHIVISLGGNDLYEGLLNDAGVKVYLLRMKEKLTPIAPLWQLHKILRSEKPDIIQTWMYHANLLGGVAARINGFKNVSWGVHMSNPKLANLSRATQFVSSACVRLSHYVPSVIVNCAERATQNHIKLGYPESKMQTIFNGYDLSVFKPDLSGRSSYRKKMNVSNDTALFGNLARWHPVKDHETMFCALSKIPEEYVWMLVLAGPDMNSGNEELSHLLKQYKIAEKCILLDQISDITEFMSALDVHILSSSDEGFPNVLAEAMACGAPCVSTDCGDAGHIIGDTGWVSPIRDPDALCAHLYEALEEMKDKTLWNVRIENAIQRIHDNFSVETMSKQYNAAWKNLLESK